MLGCEKDNAAGYGVKGLRGRRESAWRVAWCERDKGYDVFSLSQRKEHSMKPLT